MSFNKTIEAKKMIKALIGLVFCLNSILSQNNLEKFIVEGEYSKIRDFSHSAFLDISYVFDTNGIKKRASWICGSSILNQRILMTAAHCIKCKDVRIVVYYGDENTNNSKTMMALRFVQHPEYSQREPTRCDIALIKMKKDLALDDNVGRIAILRHSPLNEIATVAGWGYVNEILEIKSSLLHHITQKTMNTAHCEKLLGLKLAKGVICRGQKNDCKYFARGDSGSALVVRGYIQIGIVSHKCTNISRSIGIYTDVAYYYDWIYENAHKLNCDTDYP